MPSDFYSRKELQAMNGEVKSYGRLRRYSGGMAMAEYIEREAAMEIVKRTSGDYATAWVEIRRLPMPMSPR